MNRGVEVLYDKKGRPEALKIPLKELYKDIHNYWLMDLLLPRLLVKKL